MQKGFTAIFPRKVAESREEKARGCFGFVEVSKSVLSLNYSFNLGTLQLSVFKQQIIFSRNLPVYPLNETSKAEQQTQVNTFVLSEFVAYFNLFVGLRFG